MESLNSIISKYKLAYVSLVLFLGIVLLRFSDIRGSFFIDSYDFVSGSGVIIHSKVKSGIKPRFQLDIQYSYTVDGKEYRSERYGFGFKGSRYEDKVRDIISSYNTGDKVAVFYSEDNPELSVLNIESNSRADFLLFFSFWIPLIISLFYSSGKGKRNS